MYVVWWACGCNYVTMCACVCAGVECASPWFQRMTVRKVCGIVCTGMGLCQLCDCDSRILSPGDLCEVWSDCSPSTAVTSDLPLDTGIGQDVPFSSDLHSLCVVGAGAGNDF